MLSSDDDRIDEGSKSDRKKVLKKKKAKSLDEIKEKAEKCAVRIGLKLEKSGYSFENGQIGTNWTKFCSKLWSSPNFYL